MIKNDYILDQLEMMIKVGAKLLFKDKDGNENILIFKSEEIGINKELYNKLMAMILNLDINGAENILFESIEKNKDLLHLNTALTFYNYLYSLNRTILQAGDFTRDEIKEGLDEILELYGISEMMV